MVKKANPQSSGKSKPLRIAIIGSHGTGKTTLAKALVEKLKFNKIPDVVRMPGGAFDKGFQIDKNTLPESQFWILLKQLEFERNIPPPWISDKSLYDNIVYGQQTFKNKDFLKLIKEIVFRNAQYDLIVYLVPSFPYMHENKRSTDPEFHKIIHRKYQEFLKENNIKHTIIKEGDFEKRLNIALEIIKNAEKKSK